MKIIEKIVDLSTGTETVIERDILEVDLIERNKEIEEFEAQKIIQEENRSKKADLLNRLGITEEEAKLLLS